MKLFPVLVLFALFAAQAYAFDVGIKVTVSQDTVAVGTNVTIVKDGVLLYNIRAGADGVASFKLDAGSYFVYLDRGGYPRHVNLLEVAKTDNITYTLRQSISYAGAYGQIAGPADFNGASVTAYAKGNVVKRTDANKDGYYQMSFLPEGEYELVFSAPGFVEKNETASLIMSQFSEVNARLEKIPAVVPPQTTMTAPPTAQKQSVIEILIAKGGLPFAGQVVNVNTPAGNVETTTGTDGKAHVNAVVPGKYVFTYGNLTATTVVEGGVAPTPAQPPAAKPEPAVPAAPLPQQPSNAGLAVGVLAFALVGIIVVLAAIMFAMSRMRKIGKHGPKTPEMPHGEAHQEHTGAVHEHPGAKHEHAHAHKHDNK